jgi:outer membrane protein assembly factor BamB
MDRTSPILQSVDLGEREGRLVLYDWSGASADRYQNLRRLDSNGATIWSAELIENTGTDCFVSVSVADDSIHATTWSGYVLMIDPATGKVVDQKFVK